MKQQAAGMILVVGASVLGAAAIAVWLSGGEAADLGERLPGQTVRLPGADADADREPANPGMLVNGPGKPSALKGSWPGFRGPKRDGIAHDATGLLRAWPPAGPAVLWRVPVGEGHAGVAIHNGRVYLVDYDRTKREDAIRCLSLDDGQEIWRYTYSVHIKRNHGMSRTVPAVTDDYLVAIGPKGHVTCLKSQSGVLVWKKNLPKENKTIVPDWYAGQCPLIEGDLCILAPGGDPLMMGVELASGDLRWSTPNPGRLGMTHVSVMPVAPPGGVRQYVYCATRGVVGVAADDGRLLWAFPDWWIAIANIPSPVPLGDGRVLLTGGYNSGAVALGLTGGGTAVEEVARFKPADLGSDQQTPIRYRDHVYVVLPSGQLACLDQQLRTVWTSGPNRRFGLGPYLAADGMLFVLNDDAGTLHLVLADPSAYRELASAKVLDGHHAWAPMALAAGRLILRDSEELRCLQVAEGEE